MKLYLDAAAESPVPQTIPVGFRGRYDWPDLSDTEMARRGLPRYVPTPCDPAYEREAYSFSVDADGLTVYTTTIVPGDLDTALGAALAAVAARRWDAQNAGVSVTLAGKTWRFLTSKEAIGDVNAKLAYGAEYEAANGAGTYTTPWKSLDGYVVLSIADLKAVGMAIGAHYDACFAREADLIAMLSAKKKTETLRTALAAERDAGWPA